jgi:hypothetical protein
MTNAEAENLSWGVCSYVSFSLDDLPKMRKAGILKACELALKRLSPK